MLHNMAQTLDGMGLRRLTPVGCSLLQVSRADRSGGGVAILYKCALKIDQPVETYSTLELVEALPQTPKNTVRMCVIYTRLSCPVYTFLEEFAHYVDATTTANGQLIIVGDLNLLL